MSLAFCPDPHTRQLRVEANCTTLSGFRNFLWQTAEVEEEEEKEKEKIQFSRTPLLLT